MQYTIAAATGSAPARVGIGIKRPSLVDGLYPFQEALTRSPIAMMSVMVVVMPIVAMTAVAEAKAAIHIRPTVVAVVAVPVVPRSVVLRSVIARRIVDIRVVIRPIVMVTVVVMMTSIPYLLRLACCLRGSGRH